MSNVRGKIVLTADRFSVPETIFCREIVESTFEKNLFVNIGLHLQRDNVVVKIIFHR